MGYAVMGTGVRTGANRAVEAAMAAMASPLLEAGAIDGARGILINITGSSSLKLSEVNEASTIIQNAAHEDANIIFGAVQDESMGDEVKITVIATGFKQQEMPQRRERMLAEATLPTMRYDVPIAPRVNTTRQAAPKFASEIVPETVIAPPVSTPEAKEHVPVVENRAPGIPAPQELIPVPASVFDDDFFKSSASRKDEVEPGFPDRYREQAYVATNSRVHEEDVRSVVTELPVAETPARTPVYGGGAAVSVEQAEPDELDIPAFLRRGN
jgi:cell division protein FtsZ